MDFNLPEEPHQNYCKQLAKDILGEDWIFLKINSFTLKEDLENNISNISYEINLGGDAELFFIEGEGKGVMDALFNSIVQCLSGRFVSLNKLELGDFAIQVSFLDARRRTKTDAPVEVCLVISTSQFVQTFFRHKSTSLMAATIEVVRESVEYFINLEQASVLFRENIEDAKKRNRQDLINTNAYKMSEIVKIISLEEVLKKDGF